MDNLQQSAGKWKLRVGLVVTDETGENVHHLAGLSKLGAPFVEVASWQKGDAISTRGKRTFRNWGVRLDIFHGEDGDPNQWVDALLEAITSRNLRSTLKFVECEIAITLKLYGDETPPLGFSSNVIQRLDELGASVDIDLYVWGAP